MGWVGDLMEVKEMVGQIEELVEVEEKQVGFKTWRGWRKWLIGLKSWWKQRGRQVALKTEDEEVRVGWFGDLEEELMLCCDEVM